MAIEEIDCPAPAAKEVVIKVFAASVNPVDAKRREGKYRVRTNRPPPGVASVWLEKLGRDCAARWARRRLRRI
jgi:NADPH:quinone reductase-like Zn-dependent oxidoreductase